VEGEPVARDGRGISRRADNPLVRAVGRVPAKVGTKMLVAFVGTVVLLVVVGVLGLRVLGQSNNRVERLGALQLRASGYREVQADVAAGRLLLALRAGGSGSLLEVQTLEVIPEDLRLVGHPFPIGNVQRANSSSATTMSTPRSIITVYLPRAARHSSVMATSKYAK